MKYNIVLNNSKKDNFFFKKKGFLIKKNFLDKRNLVKLKDIIEKKNNKKNIFYYYEKVGAKKIIRRIERVTEDTPQAKKILCSKKLINYLKDLYLKKCRLFKDKLNFKHPGGGGYKPHIDGHFLWTDKNEKKKYGWKEYSNKFVSVVIPLEDSTLKNGCIFLAEKNFTNKLGKNFKDIVKKIEKNTPNIKKKYLKLFKFFPVELEIGDVLFFDWRCAHFSKKNNSNSSRMILYATYCDSDKNSNILRNKYYKDKKFSKNPIKNKSLLN